jgi:putative endonuclease
MEPSDRWGRRHGLAGAHGRTPAQRVGDAAEGLVEASLTAAGWQILARRIRVGRAEIDLLGIDPGPPPALVVVEVRWRSSRAFGLPEETVSRRKLLRLWSALARLLEAGRLPDGRRVPPLPGRVDLVAVEPAEGCPGTPRVRHHRAVGGSGGDGTLW